MNPAHSLENTSTRTLLSTRAARFCTTLATFSLLAFLLSLPIDGVITMPFVALSVTDVTLLTTTVLIGLSVLTSGQLAILRPLLTDAALLGAFVLVAVTVAAANGSAGVLTTTKLFAKLALTFLVVTYLLAALPISRSVSTILILAGVLASAVAITQGAFDIPAGVGRVLPARSIAGYQFPISRSAGLYGTYGEFGMLVISSLAVALSGVATLSDTRARFLVGGAALVLIGGLLTAQTRGVWVAATAAVIALGYRTLAQRTSFTTASGVTAAVALVLSLPVVVALRSLFAIQPATVYERLEVYRFAIRLFVDNPLVGVGYDGFRPIAREVGIDIAVHNVFLEVGLSTGLVGGCLFAGFLLRVVRRAGWLFTADQTTLLARAAPFVLIGVLIEAQLFRGLYAYELWVALGIVAGVSLRFDS